MYRTTTSSTGRHLGVTRHGIVPDVTTTCKKTERDTYGDRDHHSVRADPGGHVRSLFARDPRYGTHAPGGVSRGRCVRAELWLAHVVFEPVEHWGGAALEL